MNLHKLIFTKNACYISGEKMTPAGIMVHSTGANNPNLRRYVGPDDGLLGVNQYNNHWNTGNPDGQKVCVHGFIGKLKDGSIATYQTLPWDMVGWHSGSSNKGNANRMGYIGFEICEDGLTDPAYFNAVYKEAVELCAMLCKQYNIKPEKPALICHSEGHALGIASNHGDVMHWFPKHGKNMDTFRADVKAAMGGAATSPTTPDAPTTKALYRVRKTWADSKTQKGAFSVLANAQRCADENPGYSVFDANGVVVYPKATAGTSTDKTIWDFFTGKGLNAYAVAGITGNLYAESALKPTNLQNSYQSKLGHTDESYTKAVDNGSYTNFVKDSAGYGLAQWTYWSRKQALLEYAQKAKKSIGDLTMQLEFMWKELQGYTSVMNTLKSATSIQAASDAILTGYERPADQGASVKSKRAAYGKQYYDKYAATAGSTTPAAPAASLPYRVKITASELNIRKGPGTNYGKNGSIKDRGVYTIVDESTGTGATKWGKLKSGAGWISLDYCKKL